MAPKRKNPTKRRKKTDSTEAQDEQLKKEDSKSESRLLSKMKSIMESVQKGYTHQAKNIGNVIFILSFASKSIYFCHNLI